MRLREIVDNLEGAEVRPGTGPDAGPDAPVAGISADSREIAPGFIFVAIPGTQMDGAAFIPDAISKGAIAVVLTPAAADEGTTGNVAQIITKDPRQVLAQLASRFYLDQPPIICAVTGTNGKTSVASFLRQIWQHQGSNAASMGTLGVISAKRPLPLMHTTPDPVTVHRMLADLAEDGVTHLALEASSHGLAQHRLDGVRIAAGALTNLSRDHLDYHASFEDYLAAKLRLFTDVVRDGGAAVLNADAECFAVARDAALARGLSIISVGQAGETIRLRRIEPYSAGLHLELEFEGQTHFLELPLVGAFQASNALVAAGLALATGTKFEQILSALKSLKGAEGRMDLVARTAHGASIFVDYAHTPDALETVLRALRPHTEGHIHIVFGAGGDRDKGKRPQMGHAASQWADAIVVTDDNPRNEDPAAIRKDILAAVPHAMEIGDRRAAIEFALSALDPGDTLLVAGKGHESGQTINGVTHPFKDVDVIRELIKEAVPS